MVRSATLEMLPADPDSNYLRDQIGASMVEAALAGQVAEDFDAASGELGFANALGGEEGDAYVPQQLRDVSANNPMKNYLRNIGRIPILTGEEEIALAKRIEVGLFAKHKMQETDDPVQREELEWLAEDGEAAKRHFIEANLRLVVKYAKQPKYANRGLELLELVQAGNMGLIRAVEKFDYTKGFKFSTYAEDWIEKTIRLALHNVDRSIDLPHHMIDKLHSVKKQRSKLRDANNGTEPTFEEIAAAHGKLTAAKVESVLAAETDFMSLHLPVGDGGNAMAEEIIYDANEPDPADVAEHNWMKDRVRSAIDALDDEEEISVVSTMFGFDGLPPRSIAATSKELGITKHAVRKLLGKALRKLQRPGDTQHATLYGMEDFVR